MSEQNYLISYVWSRDGANWHYAHAFWKGDPFLWVVECQDEAETSILLNALPVTPEQTKRYQGTLAGE